MSTLFNVGAVGNAFDFLLGASGGFNWYGFLIGAGMVFCLIIAYIMSVKRGYYKDLVFDIAIVCLPLAIIGARLYYVIFDIIGGGGDWTFKEIIGLGSNGLSGLAVYGGLIGAVIGAIILHFVKKNKPQDKKATFWQMADLAFTVVLLGQIVGRWGNFVNQEAYGNFISNPTFQKFPFAVFIDNCRQANCCGGTEHWHQATFFYESFLNCFGLALLLWVYNGKRRSFDGFSLSLYCIYYGLVRIFVEGLRTDSLYLFGNVRVSQVLSGLLILFGICFIIAHFYRARSRGLKPFVMVPKDKLDNTYYGYAESILSHPNIYEKNKNGFFAKLFGKSTAEDSVDTPNKPDTLLDIDKNDIPENDAEDIENLDCDSEYTDDDIYEDIAAINSDDDSLEGEDSLSDKILSEIDIKGGKVTPKKDDIDDGEVKE